MSIRPQVIAFGAAALFASLIAGLPAQAQTALQQCSARYQAAKTANTLNGQTWNQFRARCLSEARAPAPVAPAVVSANPLRPAATSSAAATAAVPAASKATAAPAIKGVVFPKAVNAKYSKETAGKARQKTCLDQYNANKANNANGGMNWIQKGGGYYSACNNRLKGGA